LLFHQLLIKMAQNTSVIITIAFLMSRTKMFRKTITRSSTTLDKLFLIVLFTGLAIGGTYTGISIKGALANSRVIGVVVGGLLGGPVVGITVGLLAGIHRYYIGGYTALACAIATILEGVVAGYVYMKGAPKTGTWKTSLITGLVAETLQMLVILAVAHPFSDALDLVESIGLPMIVMNSAGIALFIAIVQGVFEEEEKIGALQAQKALKIANVTLPILRRGLNAESAQQVAEIIIAKTQVEAVAITDRHKILAHVGCGCSHHLAESPIKTLATQAVISNGEFKIASTKAEIGCTNIKCSLLSAVIVPLRCREEIVGTLKLYRSRENGISSLDVELAQGLAGLFSTQLELATFEEQARLVAKAELKALQAQINPHFMFNALNTIVSFCRTDGEKARMLLIQLGEFFRKNIQRGDKSVTLREELEHVSAYSTIEQARFGDTLKVVAKVEPGAEECILPALTLQPLVENAIKHGIYPKLDGGTVSINCCVRDNTLNVTVVDDGVGMTPERLEEILLRKHDSVTGAGIGLNNVDDRLKYLYGMDHGLKLESVVGIGTTISITIPVKLEEAND
jgi:two-component system, LytTR family, sensor histidine kinase LytS